ncbi:GGDEF domain-containing protein [Chitinibacter bivalviorum]|uniref:diguanylate cyclase n=1 Tax=Chitinibacter bivalviorum TaxID=2739434 RepID=A0A7H9BEZ9_9NEIS|nr:GGDEF domain-containing protein [Chitinibacter bivalviorum]QLG87135.1 GGDEF domain-containing protein [Chitinibacter bivalviorum]
MQALTPHDIDEQIKAALLWFVPDCAKTAEMAALIAPLAQRIQYREGEAEALFWRARSLWALGQLDEGRKTLRRVEQIAQQEGLLPLLGRCHDLAGDLHFSQNHYLLALKSWIKCLTQATALHEISLYTQAYIGIGNVFFAQNYFNDALRFHEDALEFALILQDNTAISRCYLNIIADLVQLQQFETVIHVSQAAQSYVLDSQQKPWLADLLSYRGQAYFELNEYELANRTLLEAFQINTEVQYRWSQALNLLALGRLALARQAHHDAEHYLQQALSTILSFQSPNLLQQAHLLLAQLATAQSKPQDALYHYREHHIIVIEQAKQQASDRLIMNAERRMKAVEVKLELLRTRHENAELRQTRASDLALLETLSQQAQRDALTGVLNRRALNLHLNNEVSAAHANNTPLAILMIDLDHFKKINDQYSHQMGDKVLQKAAAIMQDSVRNNDIVARYGGEEFTVLLPQSGLKSAMAVASRIRSRIEAENWALLNPQLKCTCSIGLALLELSDTGDSMVGTADKALYLAKKNGRNRIEIGSNAQ